MKRYYKFLIILLLIFTINMLTGCKKKETPQKEIRIPEKINFLAIGNSHTLDTTQYIEDIAKSLGIDLKLTALVIGGCTLDYHYETASNDIAAYEYRTNSGSDWENLVYPVKLEEYVRREKWDFVMIQNYSKVAGFKESFSKLNSYIDLLKSWVDEDTKFIWNMTWAYQQTYKDEGFYAYSYNQVKMYNMIASVANELITPRSDIYALNPSATAIQNARTSFLGDNLTHDGIHLNPYGRYIAGLSLIKVMTGVNIDNIEYMPNSYMDVRIKQVAIESVNNALINPFKVTQSKVVD